MTNRYTARTEFGDVVSADNIYTVFVDMRTYDEYEESAINIVQLSYAKWYDSQGV